MSEIKVGNMVREITDHNFYVLKEIKNNEYVTLFDPILGKTVTSHLSCIEAIPEDSVLNKEASETKKSLMLQNHDVTYDEFEDQYLNIFFFEKMKFCGCGNAKSNLNIVKKILQILAKESEDNFAQRKEDFIKLIGCENMQMQEFLLQSIDSYGLVDHGGSVWGSWLNQEGIELLAHLEYYEYEE